MNDRLSDDDLAPAYAAAYDHIGVILWLRPTALDVH